MVSRLYQKSCFKNKELGTAKYKIVEQIRNVALKDRDDFIYIFNFMLHQEKDSRGAEKIVTALRKTAPSLRKKISQLLVFNLGVTSSVGRGYIIEALARLDEAQIRINFKQIVDLFSHSKEQNDLERVALFVSDLKSLSREQRAYEMDQVIKLFRERPTESKFKILNEYKDSKTI